MDGEPTGGATGLEEVRRILQAAVRSIAPSWLAAEREELAQVALLRVVQVGGAEESGVRSASYLWRAAHSAVMDEIRRRRRRRETPLDEATEACTTTDSAATAPGALELRQAIDEGLSRLEQSRRQAVLLFLYGYTLEESARMVGCSNKQLDNRRYRGLADLRSFLAQRGFRR